MTKRGNANPDDKVTVNGMEQVSGVTANDFRSPVTYTATTPNGKVQRYQVTIKKRSTGFSELDVYGLKPFSMKKGFVAF